MKIFTMLTGFFCLISLSSFGSEELWVGCYDGGFLGSGFSIEQDDSENVQLKFDSHGVVERFDIVNLFNQLTGLQAKNASNSEIIFSVPKDDCKTTENNTKIRCDSNSARSTVNLRLSEIKNHLTLHAPLGRLQFEFQNKNFEVTVSTTTKSWNIKGTGHYCWNSNGKYID